MVLFALRSLLFDRVRLAISVGGVAFAILLILILRGILDGTVADATVYVDHAGADLFIAQGGVQHMAMFASIVPASAEATARSTDGVATAVGVTRVPSVIRLGRNELFVNVIGFDPAVSMGGPWSMAHGTTQLDAEGAIIDEDLARAHGLSLGSTVQISGQPFRVEGVSRGTNALGGRIAFIRRDAAAKLLGFSNIINFVLVKVTPGAPVSDVAGRLRQALPAQSVTERAQLAANDRSLLTSLFVTPINVMAFVGLLVGLMVVGLTTYSAAAERTHDFGVLKAIGARNRYLYGIILQQALLIGLSGFGLGLSFAWIAVPTIGYLVPSLGLQFQQAFVLRTLFIALGMSIVAALIPVIRIAGVDPKQVFKT
jgi:putative ABC transport system permease protein